MTLIKYDTVLPAADASGRCRRPVQLTGKLDSMFAASVTWGANDHSNNNIII